MRVRKKLKRERVKIHTTVQRTWGRVRQPIRSNDYIRLRFYWLAELCFLRAKRRNGTATMKDIKSAQRCLAKVRRDE